MTDTLEATPLTDPACLYSIAQMDAVAYLRSLPDSTFDLFVTDPAYESLEKHRKRGTTTRLTKNWFEIFKNERIHELITELYRTMKKNGHVYIFCDDETSDVIRDVIKAMIAQGEKTLTWWKRLVWDKCATGMGYHWRGSYEFVVFLTKGDGKRPVFDDDGNPVLDKAGRPRRGLNNLGYRDVFDEFPRLKGEEFYPTEKPIGLCARLIENSSKRGDLVGDCFLGAGPVGAAALRMGRRFMGCDSGDEAIKRSTKRLAKAAAVAKATLQLAAPPAAAPDEGQPAEAAA